MASLGEDDRFRMAMFESTNRLRFLVPLGDIDRNWWLSDVFDPFGLTPENVGDRLSASWAGDRRMEVTELNGSSRRFAVSIVGEFASGQAWLLERTLDFKGSFLNADRMFVEPDRQRGGIGRRFMADAVRLAGQLGLRTIRLEADNIGRYVWLRCGFLPDRGSWMSMKPSVIQRIVEARDELGSKRFAEILAIADSPAPLAARELAALDDPVLSRSLYDASVRPVKVPLGKAIFIEAAPIWSGSMDLADQPSLAVLQEYVRAEE